MKRRFPMTAKFLFVTCIYCNEPRQPSAAAIASFYYDERGSVVRQEQDTNGDGKMDRRIIYRISQATSKEWNRIATLTARPTPSLI